MAKPACIYCPTGLGTTRDHVPPRGFFPDRVPEGTQLITVPCCEQCRERDTANDETVRNILASLEDTEGADYVAQNIVPRRDRSFQRSRTQVVKMMELMHRKVVKSAKGEVVRDDLAFTLKHPSLDQFLERIGRALILWNSASAILKRTLVKC